MNFLIQIYTIEHIHKHFVNLCQYLHKIFLQDRVIVIFYHLIQKDYLNYEKTETKEEDQKETKEEDQKETKQEEETETKEEEETETKEEEKGDDANLGSDTSSPAPPLQEAVANKEDESHRDSAVGNCCHMKWGKSSLLVRCLANPKRFHCGASDRKPYLGKTHGKGLLAKILDKIDRMDTRLNHIHSVVRSIHAKHGKGSNGVLDEESGIILSEH